MTWFIGVGSYWAFDVKDNGCTGRFCCTLELVGTCPCWVLDGKCKECIAEFCCQPEFIGVCSYLGGGIMSKTMAALMCLLYTNTCRHLCIPSV